MAFETTTPTACQRFLKFANAWRLIDYLICAVLGFGGWFIGRIMRPYCKSFSWDDASIAYPYGGNGTFPSWTLAPIAVLPGVLYVVLEVLRAVHTKNDTSKSIVLRGEDGNNSNQVNTSNLRDYMEMREVPAASRENGRSNEGGTSVTEYAKRGRWRMSLEVANHWILAQAFSVALCLLIVDITKPYAGRLRPDFLARLERAGFNESSKDVDWCSLAREGRLSFPSGHSGISFASIVPLVIYLLGMLRALNGLSLWRGVVSLTPLILPITVAVSRTRDNRHHFSDILAGSLIGMCCAIFSVMCLFTFSLRRGIPLPCRLQYDVKKDSGGPGSGTV